MSVPPHPIKSTYAGFNVLTPSLETVYLNGSKAYELYKKYCADKYDIDAIKLPSTSPANAAYSIEKLYNEWRMILKNE